MNRMEKTRTFLLGLAVGMACLFLLAAGDTDSNDQANRIGRYQLSILGESKRALVIDTTTGVVKVVQDYQPHKNQFNVPFAEMK